MTSKIKCYLRTYRKRRGLSQQETAHLLGLKSGHLVSRFELKDRYPNLDTVFAYQNIFDALPHELFPGLFQKVEKQTKQRIHTLVNQLDEKFDESEIHHKRDLLMQIGKRIGSPKHHL